MYKELGTEQTTRSRIKCIKQKPVKTHGKDLSPCEIRINARLPSQPMLIGETRSRPTVSPKDTKQEVAEGFVCVYSN